MRMKQRAGRAKKMNRDVHRLLSVWVAQNSTKDPRRAWITVWRPSEELIDAEGRALHAHGFKADGRNARTPPFCALALSSHKSSRWDVRNASSEELANVGYGEAMLLHFAPSAKRTV